MTCKRGHTTATVAPSPIGHRLPCLPRGNHSECAQRWFALLSAALASSDHATSAARMLCSSGRSGRASRVPRVPLTRVSHLNSAAATRRRSLLAPPRATASASIGSVGAPSRARQPSATIASLMCDSLLGVSDICTGPYSGRGHSCTGTEHPVRRCHFGTGGLDSPRPYVFQDWAHPCHICIRTGLTHATSALGLGSPMPHLHQDWACRRLAMGC